MSFREFLIDKLNSGDYNNDHEKELIKDIIDEVKDGAGYFEEMLATQRADMGSFKKSTKKLTLDEDGARKAAVIAFGRLNPPTIGHLKLIDSMVDAAKKYNANAMLFLSHTSSNPKNPLSYESKVRWCKKAFRDKVDVVDTDAKNVFQALQELYKDGYTDIIYVGGEDRIGGNEDMSGQILKYNGSTTKSGDILYKFNNIKFENAGHRDDGSDDLVEKASASLARKLVIDDDFENFSKIVPFDNKDAAALFKELRYALKGKSEDMVNNGKILNENKFTSSDISKHSFKYLDAVTDDLLSGVDIKYDDGSLHSIDDSRKDELQDRLGEIKSLANNKDMISLFNDITGLEFTKIYKKKYSIGDKAGQSVGEGAEPIVSYIYNHPQVDDTFLRTKIDDDNWILSSKKIAEFMNNYWPSEDYVAVHVNGNDLEKMGDYGIIGRIFKSKADAANALGLSKESLNDLYQGGKDNWNKADIVLVKKDNDIINRLSGVTNGAQLNDALKSLAKTQLIPISLKKISPNKDLRIVPEGFDDSELVSADEVNVQMPVGKLDNTNNCSVRLIDNNGRIIQFRRQTGNGDNDNLSIEVNLGTARGGKSIGKLKSLLGLSGKDWYSKPIKSGNELMNYLNNNFDSVSEPSQNVLSHNSGNRPWYNRTCFRGLVSLFELYKKKYGGDCKSFFDWIYEASTTGSGAFYLIAN